MNVYVITYAYYNDPEIIAAVAFTREQADAYIAREFGFDDLPLNVFVREVPLISPATTGGLATLP